MPDFNSATGALGQQLFSPPTVARWAGGQSWITPGLLLERANFARNVLFPDISFLPPDRYTGGGEVRRVAERIRQGMDISSATMDDTKVGSRAESNLNADRNEDFNTRYGSFRGSQMAIERVKGHSARHRAYRPTTRPASNWWAFSITNSARRI